MPCLGFLPGTCCPHFDGEPERRPALHRLVAKGEVSDALALDDGAAAHFIGRRLSRIVVSRPLARGYHVQRNGSRAVEAVLPGYLLSGSGRPSRKQLPIERVVRRGGHE
jgi:peptidase E